MFCTTCDDNGSYKDVNTVKSFFFVDTDEDCLKFVRGVHCKNGKYYYKMREGRRYVDRESPGDNIYILDRYYRTNKTIQKLKMMVVRVRSLNETEFLPVTCVVYSLAIYNCCC